jgi:hypothetical protein
MHGRGAASGQKSAAVIKPAAPFLVQNLVAVLMAVRFQPFLLLAASDCKRCKADIYKQKRHLLRFCAALCNALQNP